MNSYISELQGVLMGSLGEMMDKIASSLPNLLLAIVFLVLGGIIAKFIAKLVTKGLGMVKADSLATKAGVDQFLPNMTVSEILTKVVYWLIYIFFIGEALTKLGMEKIQSSIGSIFSALPGLVVGLIIIGVGFFIARIVKNIVVTYAEKASIKQSSLIGNIAYGVIIYLAANIGLKEIGVDTSILTDNIDTIVLGAVAALALSLGLGSRSLSASMIGSRFIKNDIKVGDTLNYGDISGKVVSMNNAVVVIESDSGKTVIPISELV